MKYKNLMLFQSVNAQYLKLNQIVKPPSYSVEVVTEVVTLIDWLTFNLL